MEMPDIRHTVRDERNRVTYHVMAYRRLTREETLLSVRHFLAQPKVRRRKTPLRNQIVTILTLHGATPRL